MERSIRYIPNLNKALCLYIGLVVQLSFLFIVVPAFSFQSEGIKEAQVKQVMIRGLTFLRTGFPDKAAAAFAEGLQLSPNDPTILSAMADAQVAMRDYGLANFYIDGALKAEPQNVNWTRQALFIALEAADAQGAIRHSSRLLELQPQDVASQLAHLELLERLQLKTEATKYAEASLFSFYSDEMVQRTALRIFENAGSLSLAKMAAGQIVSITQDPDDILKLAVILIQLGELDEATVQLENALELDPEHKEATETWRSLNGNRSKEADFFQTPPKDDHPLAESIDASTSDSTALDQKLAGLDPNNEEDGVQIADLLLQNGRFRELIAFSTERIEFNPRLLKLWIYALQGFWETSQLDEALRLAEDGLQLFPGYSPLLYQYARVLDKLGRASDAQKAASEALSGADSDADLKKSIELLLREINLHQ
ncbi:MAG: tetratricopeptide repeat protein [Bacteroidetes bacterium]|nr:tetratricopeptide repeat protein [Bacteroidota bacterium]